jgi:hypothetical protein
MNDSKVLALGPLSRANAGGSKHNETGKTVVHRLRVIQVGASTRPSFLLLQVYFPSIPLCRCCLGVVILDFSPFDAPRKRLVALGLKRCGLPE